MAVKTPIYLDHNATTPIDARVLEAMMPYLTADFGNAASRNHAFGWKAEAAVEEAREQLAGLIGAQAKDVVWTSGAGLIGAQAKDVVWTSGATESNNLAIKGLAEMYRQKGNHIITSLVEHKAVIDPCKWLAETGFEVTWLKPDRYGRIHPQQVAEAITDRTILISIMAANNEVGTMGHKIYGPKGVGCLYVRRRSPRVRLACQMHGGGHERGLRSGTLNVPGIVGMGAAAEICRKEMAQEAQRLTALRDRLHEGITGRLEEVFLNGHPTERLPNTVNLSFAYVEGEAIMLRVRDIAVSSGSACTSASLEPSHVLRAMGVGDELVHSSLRFSLGRFSTAEEIDYAIEKVATAVRDLRELSPLYEAAREEARQAE